MKKKDIHPRYNNPTKEFHELKFPRFQLVLGKQHDKEYQVLDLDMIEVSTPATAYLKQHGFDRVIHYEQDNDR